VRRVRPAVRRLIQTVAYWSREALVGELSVPDKAAQIQLLLTYRELVRTGAPLPGFQDVGFRVFSQNDEDGILLYVFALLGTTNRHVVEIAAGDGIECMAANLIVHHGWRGLLVDGDAANVQRARAFYAGNRDTFLEPPTVVHSWIQRETVNDLVQRHGFSGEIDLLSLDMDGVDYWIWEALEAVQPRVVVLEFQSVWGAEAAVTVPYSESFRRPAGGSDYYGASLPAFIRLGERKGYRLVGVSRNGFNAFFVRRELGEDVLPEVPVSAIFEPAMMRERVNRRLPAVKHLDWQRV
jgi:hypothetical protein